MIYVDGRAGSRDFLVPLAKLLGKENIEKTTLDYGDFAFSGRGANDVPVDIAVEHKTLADIAACCRDGRFAGHQLPGLRKSYSHSWLMVEGTWRHDEKGFITTYQGPRRGWSPLPGKMRASEFEKHLLTFELCGGVHVRYTNTRADSVRALVDLYRWWTDRAMDAHTSHLAVHQPVTLGTVSGFRQAVMQWPGVGLKVSKAVEEVFGGSITIASAAGIDRWAAIDVGGKRLGETTARKIVTFLHGG